MLRVARRSFGHLDRTLSILQRQTRQEAGGVHIAGCKQDCHRGSCCWRAALVQQRASPPAFCMESRTFLTSSHSPFVSEQANAAPSGCSILKVTALLRTRAPAWPGPSGTLPWPWRYRSGATLSWIPGGICTHHGHAMCIPRQSSLFRDSHSSLIVACAIPSCSSCSSPSTVRPSVSSLLFLPICRPYMKQAPSTRFYFLESLWTS